MPTVSLRVSPRLPSTPNHTETVYTQPLRSKVLDSIKASSHGSNTLLFHPVTPPVNIPHEGRRKPQELPDAVVRPCRRPRSQIPHRGSQWLQAASLHPAPSSCPPRMCSRYLAPGIPFPQGPTQQKARPRKKSKKQYKKCTSLTLNKSRKPEQKRAQQARLRYCERLTPFAIDLPQGAPPL